MLKKIIGLLHPGEIILLLALSLFALLANLGLLGAAAWLISSAALLPPLYALTLGITAVRALGIGRALLRYGERYFTHKSAFAVLSNIRLQLYDRINWAASFPSPEKDKGTFLSDLLSKADIIRDCLLRGFIPPLILLLAVWIVSFLLAPLLSYYVLILPLLYLCHVLPELLVRPASDHSSHYRNYLLDFAQSSHELEMAGSVELAARRLDLIALQWQKKLLRNSNRQDQIGLLLSFLRYLSFVLLFALLLTAVNHNEISGITMSLWLLVLLALCSELTALPLALHQIKQAKNAASCLNDKPALPQFPGQNTTTDLLTVSNLAFHYPQNPPVFSGVSFTLASGCHTAIIGDSGSGKTTLAYLLAGLWQPTQGTISYGNGTMPFVCTIPQNSFLFSASIRENFLRLKPAISETHIHHCLQLAQMEEVIHHLPQGIDTPLGENACHLSGGERNRLMSALILSSTSPILLFDEPTAGLDHKTANRLLDSILDEANRTGQTILLITHDLPQLHRFKQVIRLAAHKPA